MYITGYESATINWMTGGKAKAICHLQAQAAPAPMPTTGEGAGGVWPTQDPADTILAPGTDMLITGTGDVKILNDQGSWDTL